MANELTRAYLGLIGKAVPGTEGEMLRRFAANPEDLEARTVLRGDPGYVGQTGTTCVATMLSAGHAENAFEADDPRRRFGGPRQQLMRAFAGLSCA